MSGANETYAEFPADEHYWLVKYIDQFHLPHAGTRSAAVQILLQQLPDMSSAQISRLSEEKCQDLLGQRGTGAAPQFRFVQVLVGTLPAITIGFIFHQQRKVAELPWQRRELSLLEGEYDDRDCRVGDEMPKPTGWSANLPHKTLNRYEYAGVYDHHLANVFLSKSRLVVRRRRRGADTDIYVIPRMTIFKSFYGHHAEIAKAFCSNRWSESLNDVICMNDVESGLKTECLTDPVQWNVILRTLVQDEYGPLLAVFLFDPYGRKCADAIYASSLQDRGGKPLSPWYANGTIPLWSFKERITLKVKCISLRPRFYFDEEGEKRETRKYLVTEISGCSWPSHYPDIGLSRTNSGESAANPEITEQKSPYARERKERSSDSNTVVTQQQDAHENASTTTIRGSEWNWLDNTPVVHPLEKAHSKKYLGKPAPAADDSTLVSAGAHTYQGGAAGKAVPKNLLRVVDQRFEHLMDALEALRLEGTIESFEPVPARRNAQRSDRNGWPCWKFIDEESIAYGRGPKYGWRALRHGKGEHRSVSYRTALIVKARLNTMTFYWIEIECKDNDGLRSLLVSNLATNVVRDLEAILELVVETRGRHLGRFDNMTLSSDRIISCTYQHSYHDERSRLNIERVRNVIMELQRKHPA